MRLQRQILFYLLPLTVAPLILVGAIGYQQLRNSSVRQAEAELLRTLDRSELELVAKARGVEANLRALGGSEEVRELISGAADDAGGAARREPLRGQLDDYLTTFPGYAAVRVVGADGLVLAEAARPGIAARLTTVERSAAAEAGGEVALQLIPRAREGGADLLAILPLGGGGAVMAVLALDFLQQEVVQRRPGLTGELWFADADGRPLYRQRRGGDLIDPAVWRELIAAPDRDRTRLVADGDGLRLLSGREVVPGLFAVAELREAELLGRSQWLGLVAALVTGAAILLVSGLSYRVLKGLVLDPIKRLRNAAEEIGRGNLQQPVAVDSNNEIGALAHSFSEMGANLQRSAERIHYLAYHDSLTGLPNRRMFQEYLAHMLKRAAREQRQMGVLFLDLDDFKNVNDTMGHDAGDELLTQITGRLLQILRSDRKPGDQSLDAFQRSGLDMVARHGGDEFIVLLTDLNRPHEAAAVARRVLAEVTRPCRVQRRTIHPQVSIGITIYPVDGESSSALIRSADLAMYHAKAEGKNNFQFYSETLNRVSLQRVEMEAALRRALDEERFELHYQPQVDVHSRRLLGFEALVRWNDPLLGRIPPHRFVPLAEETRLILPLGEWILEQACRQAMEWRRSGFPGQRIAVNISGLQFRQRDLPLQISRALRDSGLPPGALTLELSETVLMERSSDSIDRLAEIKRLGVEIVLDDFGTGWSSLSYLRRFPIDGLKIDRSFVGDLESDPDARAIASAILGMARSLRLHVTAEGVETEFQLAFLRERGCRAAQGHLFSLPLDAADAAARLAQG